MRNMHYDRTGFDNALVYANRMLHRYDINKFLIVKKLDYPRHLKMGGSLKLFQGGRFSRNFQKDRFLWSRIEFFDRTLKNRFFGNFGHF